MPKYLNDTGVGLLKDVVDTSIVNIIGYESVRNFDTATDMQAATDLELGMVVRTNGFHNAGDNGSAYYTIGTTDTANGMDVLACQNSLVATLVVMEPYVTPEQLGAYGDGIHDDTNVFLRLFTTYASVMLGHGATYVISRDSHVTIPLIDGLTVNLNDGILLNQWTGTFKNHLFTSEYSSITGYDGNGNITFRNGTIHAANFTMLHCDGLHFDNVTFIDSGGHAMQLGGCKNVTVTNCTFLGQHSNLPVIYEVINVECADETGQPGFASDAATYDYTTTKDVLVRNCVFMAGEDSAYNIIGPAIGTHHVPVETIDDVMTPLCDPFENIVVDNNIIYCNCYPDSGDSYNLGIRCNYWKDSIISNNEIHSSQALSVAILKYMPVDNIRIIGNRQVYDGTVHAFWSIRSGAATNLYFAGNSMLRLRDKQPLWASDAQDTISFKRCDGIYLKGSESTSGGISTFTVDGAFKLTNFSRLRIYTGKTSDQTITYHEITAYPLSSKLSLTTQPHGWFIDKTGTLKNSYVTSENTVTCEAQIRYVEGILE